MDHIQAMQIPELAQMVAPHLPVPNLQACALVCKAWHETFQPLVWSTFRFTRIPSMDQHYPPDCRAGVPCSQCTWTQAVDKNCHFIRHFALRVFAGDLLAPHLPELVHYLCQRCTSLTTVTYNDVCPEETLASECFGAIESMVMGLIERNPGLKSLSTDAIFFLRKVMQIQPNHLRALRVDLSLSVTDVLDVLTAFPHLQSLELSDSMHRIQPHMEEHAQQTTEDEAAGIRSPQFPLERLMVTNHRGCGSLVLLNDVLARCPSLQHLSLHGPNQIEKAALSLLQSGYLTCLTSLKLGRREGMTAGYELLKAIPPHQLRELIFTSPVPHFTFEAIAKLQSRNLEHLELIFHEESTHDMMALFSKCSALRSLRVMENRGSIVDIRDVLHEPWACLLLEDLKVPFRLPNSVDNTEHEMQNTGLDDSKPEILEWQQIEIRFMKQLGALTRLRRLDMSNDSWYCPFSTNEITWCLDVGLEYLVNLSQLEVLDMSNRIYIQGIPEFQWMKEHLKSLSKLVIHRFTDEEKFEWFRTHWPSLKVYEA